MLLFSAQSSKLTIEFNVVRECLKNLNKILIKRNYQIFTLLQEQPTLVENLIDSYLKSGFSVDKFTSKDVSDMLSLLFTKFISALD